MLVKRGRLAAGAAALERAGMSTSLPDFVLTVGLVDRSAPASLGALLVGPLLGLLVAWPSCPLGAKLLLEVQGRAPAGRVRRPARRLAAADGQQPAGRAQPAARGRLRLARGGRRRPSEEFARIVNETRVGRDLNDSLDEVAERMGSDDFTWVAQAIAIHREVGGNLAEVLDAVGHTIRERNAIRRQVKALSAEGKLSAIVLMALPFGIAGFISMTNPGYLATFTAERDRLRRCSASPRSCCWSAALWLKKTVAIKF